MNKGNKKFTSEPEKPSTRVEKFYAVKKIYNLDRKLTLQNIQFEKMKTMV